MTLRNRISRRTMVKGLLAGTAAGITSRFVFAAPRAGDGVFIEKQSSGAEIWQVTTGDFDHSNIYGEVPYCSRDSRYFVYERRNPELKLNRTELMVVELETWKQQRLDVASGIGGCAISQDGLFYYLQRSGHGSTVLKKADLTDGATSDVYELPPGLEIRSLGTVSPDGRYYAGGTMTEPGWKMFDITLVNLQTGEHRVLDRDPYILNPHPQFDLATGHRLMIQHNRGGRHAEDGKLEQLVGPEGATLYLLSVPDGQRTLLQVGTPYTTACTGHEAWIGKTDEMLLSVAPSGDFDAEKGNLLAVAAGQPARVVARGYRFNHVGVSRCGRVFSADDWQTPYKIVLGSTKTPNCDVVCESKTVPDHRQSSHPHPYVTPDLKWLVFNSNRSGPAHIYAARIPDQIMSKLLS